MLCELLADTEFNSADLSKFISYSHVVDWKCGYSRLSHVWTVTSRHFYLNVSFTEWRDEARNLVRFRTVFDVLLAFFRAKYMSSDGIIYFKKWWIVFLILWATVIESTGYCERCAVWQAARQSLLWFFRHRRLVKYTFSVPLFDIFYAFHIIFTECRYFSCRDVICLWSVSEGKRSKWLRWAWSSLYCVN